MSSGFFGDTKPVKYEGPDSTDPLAYRFYNPNEIVLGKRLEDHLRFAIAYWHSFVWPGATHSAVKPSSALGSTTRWTAPN